MTVKEAARRLEIHPSTLYDMARDGLIPCRRVGPKGGRVIFDPRDVEAYWEACKRQGGQKPQGELKHIKV